MNAAVPVDHDAIERDLDRQLGVAPKKATPKRERTWACLTGEAQLVCDHVRIDVVRLLGRDAVTCLGCGHEWTTVHEVTS